MTALGQTNNSRLRKHVKLDEEKAKNPRQEKTHAGRENDPRYLFGVRALEKGHFGGVAQTSRPNSVSPSAPSSAGSNSNLSLDNIANSNRLQHQSRALSPLEQSPNKKKPSPLRIHPMEVLPGGPKTHSPTSPGSRYVVSPVTPPIPPPSWSLPIIQEPEAEPFGLSFPKATADPSRPTSFLPKLDFSEAPLYIYTPSGSVRGKRSNRESTATVATAEATYLESVTRSRRVSILNEGSATPSIPPRSSLRSQRSTSSIHNPEFPTTKRTQITNSIPVPPIPATYNSHSHRESIARSPSLTETIRETSTRLPSITDSGYGSPIVKSYAKRKSSDAVSLAILTGNSAISFFPKFEEPSTIEEPMPALHSTASTPLPFSRGRNLSQSTVIPRHNRQTTSSLIRTDSLQHHTRNLSRNRSTSNRRDKQRDQIHYDPTSHHRNRSGSIQGRSVDFSHPRSSPFTDLAASTFYKHSPSSSTASDNSVLSYYTTSHPSPVLSPSATFDLQVLSGGGSKLRFTKDNFGTGGLEEFAMPSVHKNESISVISLKDSAMTREDASKAKMEKVQRLKPVRVSSHDGEFLMPGYSTFETHSTSTSPIVEERERFPSRVVLGERL